MPLLPKTNNGRLVAAGALVGLAGLTACGGSGSPSASSALPASGAFPAGTVLSVVSGETGQGVAGARLVVGGLSYLTDSTGQASLGDAASVGASVDVTATGFLERQTLLRADRNTRFALWPRTSPLGIDDAYTAAIVYTAAGSAGALPGSTPLRRLGPGTSQVTLVLSAELARDDAAQAQLQRSAAVVTEALRGRVTYLLASSRPSAGVFFDLQLNPADAQCRQRPIAAYTLTTLFTDEITGGRLVFCSLDYARTSVATHELGHTFGVQHSPDGRELMTGLFVRELGPPASFSARETMIMQLMQERRAGNRFPDNDRVVGASALRELVVACP